MYEKRELVHIAQSFALPPAHFPSRVSNQFFINSLPSSCFTHTNENTEKGSDKFFKILRLFYGLFVVGVVAMSLRELKWATTLEQGTRWSVERGGEPAGNWVRTNMSHKLSNGLLLPSLWVQTAAQYGSTRLLRKNWLARQKTWISASAHPFMWAWTRPAVFLTPNSSNKVKPTKITIHIHMLIRPLLCPRHYSKSCIVYKQKYLPSKL